MNFQSKTQDYEQEIYNLPFIKPFPNYFSFEKSKRYGTIEFFSNSYIRINIHEIVIQS